MRSLVSFLQNIWTDCSGKAPVMRYHQMPFLNGPSNSLRQAPSSLLPYCVWQRKDWALVLRWFSQQSKWVTVHVFCFHFFVDLTVFQVTSLVCIPNLYSQEKETNPLEDSCHDSRDCSTCTWKGLGFTQRTSFCWFKYKSLVVFTGLVFRALGLWRVGSSQFCRWRNYPTREKHTPCNTFKHDCRHSPFIRSHNLKCSYSFGMGSFYFFWPTYHILSFSTRCVFTPGFRTTFRIYVPEYCGHE